MGTRSPASAALAGALLASAMLAGCATPPGQPTRQTVRVETPACEAARCVLRNDRGRWVVPRTPGEVEIVTSNAPVSVSCRAQGALARTTQPIVAAGSVSGQGATVGAAVGGGLTAVTAAPLLGTPYAPLAAITVAFSALVGGWQGYEWDASRRAMVYPGTLVVGLQCPAGAAADAPTGPPMLGLTVRGVAEADAENRGAVRVTAVVAGAPAQQAGLQPGDLVLAVDDRRFDGTLGFEIAIRGSAGPWALTVRRAGVTQVLSMRSWTPP